MTEVDTRDITNRAVPITAIKPHPENYNRHPDEQVRQLGASYESLGQFRSVVLWQQSDGSYIQLAGHGVLEAMKREGATEVRADIMPPSLDAMMAKRIMLADNLHAQNSEPDETLLAQLLQEQQDAGYDLASMGSDDETLRQMLEILGDEMLAGEREEGDGGDEFDATPEEGPTLTHVGELWQLGKHRLLVGDCTDIGNVQKLMDGERADCCWTDPPYGVNYVGKTKDELTIKNDGKEDLDAFLQRAFAAMDTALDDGAAIYIAHPAGAPCLTFGNRFVAQGWKFHQTLIWVKDSMVLGHSDYHFRHEPIYFGYKPGAGRLGRGGSGWYGDDSQKSVFEIPRPKRSDEHPTTKPVDLMISMLQNSCPAGGLVYDPFAGSGSTMIAAHRLRMRCYMCELDPRYADVILRRYEAEASEEATLLKRVEEVAHA